MIAAQNASFEQSIHHLWRVHAKSTYWGIASVACKFSSSSRIAVGRCGIAEMAGTLSLGIERQAGAWAKRTETTLRPAPPPGGTSVVWDQPAAARC